MTDGAVMDTTLFVGQLVTVAMAMIGAISGFLTARENRLAKKDELENGAELVTLRAETAACEAEREHAQNERDRMDGEIDILRARLDAYLIPPSGAHSVTSDTAQVAALIDANPEPR